MNGDQTAGNTLYIKRELFVLASLITARALTDPRFDEASKRSSPEFRLSTRLIAAGASLLPEVLDQDPEITGLDIVDPPEHATRWQGPSIQIPRVAAAGILMTASLALSKDMLGPVGAALTRLVLGDQEPNAIQILPGLAERVQNRSITRIRLT